MVLGLPLGLLCGLLLAQAQALPVDPAAAPPAPGAGPPVAASTAAEPDPPAFVIGLAIGGGHRLAAAGEPLPPAYGMSVATLFGRRYHTLRLGAADLELGLAMHFDYQRYTRTVTIPIMGSGPQMTFEDLRSVSYYDFAALQTLTVPFGRVRLVAGAGAGLTIGHFSSLEPELRPGEARLLRPLLRASLGTDVSLGAQKGRLGLTVGMTLVLREPVFKTSQDRHLQVFGDRASANVTYSIAF